MDPPAVLFLGDRGSWVDHHSCYTGCVATECFVLAGLFGAAVGAVFYEDRWDDMRSLAVSAVLVIGFGGALVSAFYAASGGIMLPPSPRYVWGAFAAFAVPLLVVAHRRVVFVPAVFLWGFGILAWWTFELT